ncbi:Zinc import ATP-binding protein ZnuC [compost metagenome]
MKTLLEATDLQALSKEGTPLSPAIQFQLQKGEVLFWTGDNGAGKSTLLKTLLGLHSPSRGSCRFHFPIAQVQYLPQLGSLHFHIPLTLRDMLPDNALSPLLKGLDLSKKWNTASGGERQKVLLAAALLKKPQVLILDEPFNHVDRDSALVLEQGLQDFIKESPESAMIMVSHRALVQSWPSVRFMEIR